MFTRMQAWGRGFGEKTERPGWGQIVRQNVCNLWMLKKSFDAT